LDDPHQGYGNRHLQNDTGFTSEELITLRGKINGSITSEKKKASSRLNGLKGGQAVKHKSKTET
jgi:hypothetical protein